MNSRVFVAGAVALALAGALDAPGASAQSPISNVSEGSSRPATRADVTIGGYVEAFYQWNFNRP